LQDPPKFTQNWDFWFENKPSGNPAPKRDGTIELGSLTLKNRRTEMFFFVLFRKDEIREKASHALMQSNVFIENIFL
jgi:hypothetical protein